MDRNFPGTDASSVDLATQENLPALKVDPISRDDFRTLRYDRKTICCHLPKCEIDFSPLNADRWNLLQGSLEARQKTETTNVEEFKARWTEASAGLAKTPMKPLIAELGNQLASGKLNPEALQKALAGTKISEDEFSAMSRQLKLFREDLKELYGLDLQPTYSGKGDQISLECITLCEANGAFAQNAMIKIDKAEKLSATVEFDRGFNGPITSDVSVDAAMKKIHSHVKTGRVK